MIPILYEATETAFISNGLGRLADAISCKVIEERNATYELEMTYPVSGVHYSDIQENRIILAQPHEGGLTEPFQIYKVTKPLNGVITVNAEHISYRLNKIVVMPFSAGTIQEAFLDIPIYSATTNNFTFTTDIVSDTDYSIDTPRSVRSMLGGSSGSILDVYGRGDYEFSRFNVILHQSRGADNGVTLRYGKNITDLKSVVDMSNVYTGIVPFWSDGENTVTLTEKVVLSEHTSDFPYYIIKPVDMSSNFEEAPSEEQLRTKAQQYVANNEGWELKKNITVSFVALWNTEEYKNIAPLERVQMCDTVHVVYKPLGVDFTTKVVKTDYNVLEERYNAITLGDTYYTLNGFFEEEISTSEENQTSHMQKAIARATKLIQGGLGGHVVFNTNADGEPQEILIMDTDDITTAVNVIRMNLNGIGFSTSGYNGPFTTAWTIDGHFVANFIDTGTLTANIIKTGVLADEAGNTTFNLATGALSSKNLTINSTYFKLDNTGKITSITEDGRKLVMEKGKITGYKIDGTESAALEIGDGYFNIIGQLALNGKVGVSGATSFVKGISYEETTLGTIQSKDIYVLPSNSLGNVHCTVSGGSVTIADVEVGKQSVTVTGYVDGKYASLSGTTESKKVSIKATYSNPSVSFRGERVEKAYYGGPSGATLPTTLKYLKAIEASTGAINSAYGIIQSIS